MLQVDDRFWAKVDPGGDCWEWTASTNAGGYGQFRVGSSMRLAHRVAYGSLVGSVGHGLDLDHLCRNRRCVNPDHLEPVSRRVNILRGASSVAAQARQTNCLQGHPFDEVNSYVDARGRRVCRACVRRRVKEQRARGVRYDKRSLR